MSGDAQVRQRRKEKRKQKRDEPAIGVDTAKITESEKKTVQMHIADDHDHGVGWCAKIIFFTLMAILAGLVVLIVLENRGGSDLDTPLSESRFSDYLQGWVDETRQDDHHDEPHISSHDDGHDDDDGDGHDEHPAVPDDEPYPEEKDESNPEDNNESEELNAEVNLSESEPNESQEPADDNDSQNDEETEETKEAAADDDDDNDDDERGDQTPGAEDNSDNDNTEEVPSLFEDSTPFEEETNKSPEKILKGSDIKNQVDELIETFNDIAKMLGKENATKKTMPVTNKVQIEKETRAGNEKEDNDDDFEDVVDNDAGEDLLLQKLAEQSEAAAQQTSHEDADEPDTEGSSSQIPKEAGGAQSYADELSKDHDSLENFPHLKDLYDRAKLLDAQADKKRSNERLLEALTMYKQLIVHHGLNLSNQIFKEIAARCIERMRFIGKLKAAVEIHKKLIERFDDEPEYRNQLAVTYLLGNHLSVAKLVLHEVLVRWRYNGFALVHYGFVLKNLDQDYENAALYLEEGINTDEPGTQDGRFYFNLGDALQRLGRNDEARAVYQKGAAKGLFLSEYQRSLYNVDRLKSIPFWTKVQTTYKDSLMEIQKYWQIIRDEGLKLLSEDGMFTNEAENLKETGDWKQLELYARGQKTKNCKLAPMTCKVLESFKPAASCKRGQVKFSVLHPNTHVFSHCGPTNCRIRCHLGLKVPEKTFIRVADETKSWKEGEWLIFDDSFEHEVWHNGTSLRLVLIIDVWHPDLTEDEKQSLSAI